MLVLEEKLIQRIYKIDDAIQDIKDVLAAKYHEKIENPLRTVIEFPEHEASVLYMPSADLETNIMTMKAVTIFPHNPQQDKPTTQGIILLSDAQNGDHLALINASYLTRLRTGALSGVATELLASKNSKHLLVIGTGGMAFEQVLGVLAVREIQVISLYNRTEEKAHTFKEKLLQYGINSDIEINVISTLSEAIDTADIINCATRSTTPVFEGISVKEGAHVNGVGSYLPHMREVDFDFIQRCDKIVVDDYHGVTEEAGELIHANEQPTWSYEKIHGELKDLSTKNISSRESENEITFFKCVGSAYFDLAVAQGVYSKAKKLNKGVKISV